MLPEEYKTMIDSINMFYGKEKNYEKKYYFFLLVLVALMFGSFIMPFVEWNIVIKIIYIIITLLFIIFVIWYMVTSIADINKSIKKQIASLNSNLTLRNITFALLEIMSYKEHCEISNSDGYSKLDFEIFKKLPAVKLLVSFSTSTPVQGNNDQEQFSHLNSQPIPNSSNIHYANTSQVNIFINNNPKDEINSINLKPTFVYPISTEELLSNSISME
ncbi:expressed protein [Dictyostelium purpureum]|uniref:Expressed protein n=1 Tax=Dictyostelium purpureum TaxID=5786 RepID=F0ZFV6_DICPU|nr:uncharacterized protein DICPUDRAFT_94137 [Dictyostelium purpureum]EGC37180.1 expressed protein [Dictyostelium purpureum]|eukprot:XP_003286308.1 expressed protein [Dictyostelium purpureum]